MLRGYLPGAQYAPNHPIKAKLCGISLESAVNLCETPLYSFPRAAKPSVYVSGAYYLHDGKLINGRCRVTDKAFKAGKRPTMLFAVGWLDENAVK